MQVMSASPAKDPEQPDHLIDHIKTAAAARTPLRITGGDTKAFYGEAVAGQPLSTRDWTGIVSHEPTELVITVRAGTPLADVEAGLAGPARATVGGVRDFVLGAQFIDGRGEWLSFGGQVMKNVAGYDVSRALAGSMGTLGVITHLSLKVLPVAPAEATLVFRLDQ